MATNLRRHRELEMPAPKTGRIHVTDNWKAGTPLLETERVTVRGLRCDDAVSLFELCATEPVGRFLWPPPSSAERFSRFIEWARDQQAGGRQICFAVSPAGSTTAAGLIQVRQLEPSFATAEWGFVVGEPYWGTGLFISSARLVLSYLFETVGVRRLEARTVVTNGRANGALQKLGAAQEGRLRKGFCAEGRCYDQYLWSILAEEWNPLALSSGRFH
jgi:ribosomal-protein-alanine N-acetyltransferase